MNTNKVQSTLRTYLHRALTAFGVAVLVQCGFLSLVVWALLREVGLSQVTLGFAVGCVLVWRERHREVHGLRRFSAIIYHGCRNPQFGWAVSLVASLSRSAHLPAPEVRLRGQRVSGRQYPLATMTSNLFGRRVLALNYSLLSMPRDSVAGMLAHEIRHHDPPITIMRLIVQVLDKAILWTLFFSGFEIVARLMDGTASPQGLLLWSGLAWAAFPLRQISRLEIAAIRRSAEVRADIRGASDLQSVDRMIESLRAAATATHPEPGDHDTHPPDSTRIGVLETLRA